MKINLTPGTFLITGIAFLLMIVFAILLITAPHIRQMEPLQFYLLLSLVFLALVLLILFCWEKNAVGY